MTMLIDKLEDERARVVGPDAGEGGRSPHRAPAPPAPFSPVGASLRLAGELRRRALLVRGVQPAHVPTPPLRLLAAEIGQILFQNGLRFLHGRVRLDKASRRRAVMLLPGFGSHPGRMAAMRRALEDAGHSVSDWGLGWNLGPTEERFARLCSRIEAMARREGQPLVLVGWSLGGVFAREAAKRQPDSVAKVVTLGSPFSGDMRGNNAWRIYQCVTGHAIEDAPIAGDFAAKPPVPTVALWSARDGVVHRRCARGRRGERDEAIAIRCSHMGFAWHPQAIAAVAREIEKTPAPGFAVGKGRD